MAQRERSLEIAIRAKDDYSKKLEQAKRQHTEFRQFVEKNAASRTALSTAADEAREVREAYAQATRQAREYGDVVRKLSNQGSLTAEEAEYLSAHGHAMGIATAKAKGYREELRKRQDVVRGLAAEESKLNAAIGAGARRRAFLASGRNSGEGLRSETSYINRVRTDGDVQPMQTDKAFALREVVTGRMALREARAEQEAYRASLDKLRASGDGFEAEIRQMETALASADNMVVKATRNLNERLRALNVLKATEAAAAARVRELAEAQEREAQAAARTQAALEKANAARRATAETPVIRGDERAYKNGGPAPVIVPDNAKMAALRGVVDARRDVEGTTKAVEVLARELRELTASGNATESQIKELSGAFDRAKDDARSAKAALAEKSAALQKLRDSEAQAAAAARQMAEAQEATVVKLRRVGDATQTSEIEQRRLANAIRGTTAEMRKQAKVAGDAARKELAEYEASLSGAAGANGRRGGWAERMTGAWGTQQGRGPLGLRPYELTNLSYQVNDVVSGLAMGQAPMQVFAQQAGQIIQIFPKMAASILRMSPAIAILAPFAIALNRISSEAALLKGIERQLDLMATGASYSARELAEMTGRLDDAGASAKDAKAAMDAFLGARLDGSLFDALGNAALNLSKLEGTKVPEAAEKITDAFKGGVDGVRELDAQMGFLTAGQYEAMRALAATGDEAGALRIAAEALDARLQEVAGATEGWASAIAALGGAWDALMTRLANNDILQAVAAGFGDLGDAVGAALGDIEKLLATPELNVPDVEIDITMSDDQLTQEIDNARNMVEAGMRIPIPDAVLSWLGLEDMAEAEAYFNERLRLLEEESRRREQIAQDATNQAKLETDIQSIVDETVKSLADQVEQSKLTSREREIQKALDAAREEAQQRAIELGLTFLDLTEAQTAAIREQAGALFDRNNAMSSAEFSASYSATRFSGGSQAEQQAELVAATTDLARQMGISAKDLLTAFSYETGGTLDPWQAGPTTQWGQHRGLIQWGEPQRAKYGVSESSTITEQVMAAGRYLADAGVRAGDGLHAIYAAINTGTVKGGNRTDENNGGAPGTANDKVNNQMEGHKARAEGLLSAYSGVAQEVETTARESERAAEADRRRAEQAERFRQTQTDNLDLQELELSLSGAAAGEKAAQLAVAQAEVAAKRAGVQLTEEEKQRIGDLARMKAELAEASKAGSKADKERTEQLKQAKALEQEVTRLKERQKFLQDERTYAMDRGDSETIAKVDEELKTVNTELDAAIQKAIAFWQALGGEGSAMAIQKLEQVRTQMGRMGEQSIVTAEQMNELFAGAILSAFDTFARGMAEGQSAAEAFATAFRQMASQILIEIGKIILKAVIMRALMSIFPGLGGLGGAMAGGINGMFFHDGGKVGMGGRSKQVPVSSFLGATRYHSGGIAGLEANEVAAVLEEGEEVLTQGDPRHRDNIGAGGDGSGGGKGMPPMRIMNVLNGSEVMKAALAETGGGELFMNFIGTNKDEIKALLGD